MVIHQVIAEAAQLLAPRLRFPFFRRAFRCRFVADCFDEPTSYAPGRTLSPVPIGPSLFGVAPAPPISQMPATT